MVPRDRLGLLGLPVRRVQLGLTARRVRAQLVPQAPQDQTAQQVPQAPKGRLGQPALTLLLLVRLVLLVWQGQLVRQALPEPRVQILRLLDRLVRRAKLGLQVPLGKAILVPRVQPAMTDQLDLRALLASLALLALLVLPRQFLAPLVLMEQQEQQARTVAQALRERLGQLAAMVPLVRRVVLARLDLLGLIPQWPDPLDRLVRMGQQAQLVLQGQPAQLVLATKGHSLISMPRRRRHRPRQAQVTPVSTQRPMGGYIPRMTEASSTALLM